MYATDLFYRLKTKGVFWSYDPAITLDGIGEQTFIEHLLKYGDIADITAAMALYGENTVRSVWEQRMVADKRFIKMNVMLARLFFNMDVDSDYFRERQHGRFGPDAGVSP